MGEQIYQRAEAEEVHGPAERFESQSVSSKLIWVSSIELCVRGHGLCPCVFPDFMSSFELFGMCNALIITVVDTSICAHKDCIVLYILLSC